MPTLKCKNKRCSEYGKKVQVIKYTSRWDEAKKDMVCTTSEGFCKKCKKQLVIVQQPGPINTVRLGSPDKSYRKR